jgi:carboxylesterase
MRGIAEALANAGFSVEMPLLPGHGTSIEDMVPTRFEDWSTAADAAYAALTARTERVAIVGLSMGGTLTCWLAEHHPEVAGIAVINGLVEFPGEEFVGSIRGLLDAGVEVLDGLGSDIKKEGVEERAYPGTPVAPLVSLLEAVESVGVNLGKISCPVLAFTSLEDHVVPPTNGEFLEAMVGGPIERVLLENSYHVATLDNDAELVEAQIVAFVERLAS